MVRFLEGGVEIPEVKDVETVARRIVLQVLAERQRPAYQPVAVRLPIIPGDLDRAYVQSLSSTVPGILAGTAAARPAFGTEGRIYIATDTGEISRDTGAAWARIAIPSTGLTNADIAAGAGIVYSKLALTGGIVNADVGAAAAIAGSKLDLALHITNAMVAAGAAIAGSKLDLALHITNAMVAAGAAIAYSKLNLASAIQLTDLAFNGVAAPAASRKIAGGEATATTDADGDITVSTGLTSVLGASALCTTQREFCTREGINGGDVTFRICDHAGNFAASVSRTVSWVAFGT